MNVKTVAVGVGILVLGAAALMLRRGEPGLEGTWTGNSWGRVVFVDGQGTYTDTYGTGPGTLHLTKAGERAYEGTWGESPKRHGTLAFTLSKNGELANGTWKADEDCEIQGSPGGAIQWIREK